MRATFGCERKYNARFSPPASTARSSCRNSCGPGTIITGWLFSTKSCASLPGVRFSPRTPRTLIDMPRTSFSRSEADAAFANRIQAV